MKQVEHALDVFANLYVDAISYREDHANLSVRFGEKELEAVKFMRDKLMHYLTNKHGVSPETHDLVVDTKQRKLFITDRRPQISPVQPQAPTQESEPGEKKEE